MKYQVHRFSLLEVIIAMSLFSILIFSTTTLFFRYHKLFSKIEINKPYLLEKNLFYKKMLEITATLDATTINAKKTSYTQSMNFTFDNGIKDTAKFSGQLLGKIYKDLQDNIVFEMETKNKETKKSILLSMIRSFTYSIDGAILSIKMLQTNDKELIYCFFIQGKEEKL